MKRPGRGISTQLSFEIEEPEGRERYREVEGRVRGVRESLKFLQRSVLCEYLDKRAHVAG